MMIQNENKEKRIANLYHVKNLTTYKFKNFFSD